VPRRQFSELRWSDGSQALHATTVPIASPADTSRQRRIYNASPIWRPLAPPSGTLPWATTRSSSIPLARNSATLPESLRCIDCPGCRRTRNGRLPWPPLIFLLLIHHRYHG
jgi:hypothetical protein